MRKQRFLYHALGAVGCKSNGQHLIGLLQGTALRATFPSVSACCIPLLVGSTISIEHFQPNIMGNSISDSTFCQNNAPKKGLNSC
jgi:hypothetical protein